MSNSVTPSNHPTSTTNIRYVHQPYNSPSPTTPSHINTTQPQDPSSLIFERLNMQLNQVRRRLDELNDPFIEWRNVTEHQLLPLINRTAQIEKEQSNQITAEFQTKREMKRLEMPVDTLMQQHQVMMAQNLALQHQVVELTTQMAAQNQALIEEANRRKNVEQHITHLYNIVNLLTEKMNKSEGNLRGSVSLLTTRLEVSITRLQSIEKEIQGVNTKTDQNFTSLAQRIKRLENKLCTLSPGSGQSNKEQVLNSGQASASEQ